MKSFFKLTFEVHSHLKPLTLLNRMIDNLNKNCHSLPSRHKDLPAEPDPLDPTPSDPPPPLNDPLPDQVPKHPLFQNLHPKPLPSPAPLALEPVP